MKPRRTPHSNVVYELPGGNEDNSLWCERSEPGTIISEWEPTPAERAAIANGARISLVIFNEPIPPVAMYVEGVDGG